MSTATIDQAQAVYAAEDLWEQKEPQARIKFGDWNEVQPFYVKLAKRFRDADVYVLPPTVRPRKGALQAHYDAGLKSVFMPPYDKGGVWALKTATAVHEFAHHLSPGAGHGPEFRQAMIDCLEILGWDADLLADCYAQAGLTTSDKGDGITDRVSKLLTHADGAGRTDAERRSFIEKAERLAAEHSINLALLRKKAADANGHNPEDRPITGEMFPLTALPNVTHRNLAVELGSAIARAHGAQCTIRGKSQWMTFYGFPEDVTLTELMLTRVTPMMFEEADRYLKSEEHRCSGTPAVSARITFCKNFAYEVGRRLREAVKQSEKTVTETLEIGDGTVSTELVLREKAVEVRDYVAHEFKRQGVKGSWKGSNTNTWSGGAANAGKTSAQNANLFGRKELS
jgi:putative metallohydrolase (TIGR04338 family)